MACKWCAIGECWGCPSLKKGGGKGKGRGKGGSSKGAGKDGKMAAMMNMMMGGWDGGSSSSGSNADKNYKSQLIEAYAKKNKTPITKETIQYEVTEVDDGKGAKYQAGVTIDGNTYMGAVAKGKKDAENNAAMVAMKDLFPGQAKKPSKKASNAGSYGGDDLGSMMMSMMSMMGGAGGATAAKSAAQGGNKRKADDHAAASSPKQRLNQGVMLMKQGTDSSKEDVVYSTSEVDGETGKYVSTVTVAPANKTFTGPKKDNKKDAENAAATVALKELKDQIKPLEEEHKAKKQKKMKENLEKLKAKAEEKKGEQKTA